jgi:hypothetical protein
MVAWGAGDAPPPALRLLDETLVVRSPATVMSAFRMATREIQRGYEAVFFSIEPSDLQKGSHWVAYDTALCAVTTLMDDLNAVCGQTGPGVPGQRVGAVSDDGRIVGTRSAVAPQDYPGGHVLVDGKDLGIVEPGASVVRLVPLAGGDGLGAKRSSTATDCVLLVARRANAGRYRLYLLREGRITFTGVEGGASLSDATVEGTRIRYRNDQGLPCSKELIGDSAPANGSRSLRGADGPVAGADSLEQRIPKERLVPCQYDSWSGADRWRRTVQSRESTMGPIPGVEGFLCFAQSAANTEDSARLFLYTPGVAEPQCLGSLHRYGGRALPRVHQLRVLPSGDIVVLAGNDGQVVLQHYESPLIDAIASHVQREIARAQRHAPYAPLQVRTVSSLYALAGHADRGFECIATASDGCVYFGSMPHHPTQGTPIFRFTPDSGRMERLGVLDALSGDAGPGRIPSMMHTAAVEVDRRLYFCGQDPFYGSYQFPGMGRETCYAGSPLVGYDLTQRTFKSLGRPIPSGPSIFKVVADPVRKVLYLRQGYWRQDWRWYELALAVNPASAARPEPLPFTRQPSTLHVAPDGNAYFCVPQGDSEAYRAQGAAGKWDVVSYDPAKMQCAVVASLDPMALMGPEAIMKIDLPLEGEVDWITGQQGAEEVLASLSSLGLVVRFNTRTRSVQRACLWMPEAERYPLSLRGPMCLWRNSLLWLCSDGNARPFRTTRPMLADLRTGRIERFGALVDQNGRYVEDVTQAIIDADGRIHMGGQVWGAPEDRAYCRRGRAGMPAKLDSCFLVMDDFFTTQRQRPHGRESRR